MLQRVLKTSAEMFSDRAERPVIVAQNYPATAVLSNGRARSGVLQQILELKAHDVYKLERKTCTVKVMVGTAWMSLDGQDYVVESGQEITLTLSKDWAIISSPNSQPVRFEVS